MVTLIHDDQPRKLYRLIPTTSDGRGVSMQEAMHRTVRFYRLRGIETAVTGVVLTDAPVMGAVWKVNVKPI